MIVISSCFKSFVEQERFNILMMLPRLLYNNNPGSISPMLHSPTQGLLDIHWALVLD